MRKASAEIPEIRTLKLVMLGRVGQSLPSQRTLAELGCCSCFSRPPRQAYLRDALSVALSGGEKITRMKPDFTMDIMRTAPKNLRYSSLSNTCGLLSAPSRSKKNIEQQLDVTGSPLSQTSVKETLARSPKILIVVRLRTTLLITSCAKQSGFTFSTPFSFLMLDWIALHCRRTTK